MVVSHRSSFSPIDSNIHHIHSPLWPMHRNLLAAKIHSCTITAANLHYMGSISIDEKLLNAVGIVPYEQVQVVNVNNGERFITYAIAAAPGSGAIELNGAAARLGVKGDKLIVMTYAQFSEHEVPTHRPQVAIVDDLNQIVELKSYIPTGFGDIVLDRVPI